MANGTIAIKRGDTGIALRATLTNEKGNVDLSQANVLFLMGDHEIETTQEDAIGGVVNVIFDRGHTDVPGIYRAEFEVQFEDGRVETFPNSGYLTIKIMRDLGGVN